MSRSDLVKATAQLNILSTQVVSFAGDSSEMLHAAVMGNISGARVQTSSLYAIGDEYAEAAPVLAAPMSLQGATRRECLTELIYRALSPLITQVTSEESSTIPMISILLPMHSERYIRAKHIDFEELKETLCKLMPELDPVRVTLTPHQLGATAELLRMQQALIEKGDTQMILCGADSLINSLTYLDMAERGILATKAHMDGVVPGEGAAAILLELGKTAHDETSSQPLAKITGMASVPEVHVGQAAQHPLKAAATAMRQASVSSPSLLEESEKIFVGQAQGLADDLEWNQIVRQLWPQTLPEQERLAMMMGEVDAPQPTERDRPHRIMLSLATGEVGAASLPMQLAIACEQFHFEANMARFGYPPSKPLMILENGDYPIRGAIVLNPPIAEV
jgi:hypothetical protein